MGNARWSFISGALGDERRKRWQLTRVVLKRFVGGHHVRKATKVRQGLAKQSWRECMPGKGTDEYNKAGEPGNTCSSTWLKQKAQESKRRFKIQIKNEWRKLALFSTVRVCALMCPHQALWSPNLNPWIDLQVKEENNNQQWKNSSYSSSRVQMSTCNWMDIDTGTCIGISIYTGWN